MKARPSGDNTRAALTCIVLVTTLLLGSCTWSEQEAEEPESAPVAASSPTATPTRTDGEPNHAPESTPPEIAANPVIRRIPHKQWEKILATGVWRPGCPAGRRDLRRVEINHHTFDGTIRRGVLVVNRDVADSVSRIFTKLFEAGFPIRKMRPVEVYGGDVNANLRDDNTSAYNCRQPSQINAPTKKSPHANGRAVDINPVENPWKDLRCKCWLPNRRNRLREPGPGVILKGGLVWRTFRAEGWIWQNIDVPDYMHFDTGYPSRSFDGRARRRNTAEEASQ